MAQSDGLTDDERAELEQLRAEKAAAEQAAAERNELEELRHEKAERERELERARAAEDAATDAHIAEIRERNRKLMEPDDDLKMPIAQKIVLVVVAVVVIAFFYYASQGL